MTQQQLSPGAETILDERTDFRLDEGDHERFSHYVPKDKLTEAMVMGTPVIALCGKVWVPNRDPQRFPVCPECKEIWEGMPGGGKGKGGKGGRDKGGDGGQGDGGQGDGGSG
ncbi:MAG: DUF3039 domain-containing protein [Microlunatus sp.]|nr:DUF3039 domain-containing protein [Microlunatus sp.]